MYVLDIDVTRNGNNLKLKVKSEFSLSMGLMLINHSNPYIHSTTVMCDSGCVAVVSDWVSSFEAAAVLSLLFVIVMYIVCVKSIHLGLNTESMVNFKHNYVGSYGSTMDGNEACIS